MTPEQLRAEIISDLGSFTHDPLGFVMWAWPWGEPGTPLEDETGPDKWQRDQLNGIAASLRADPHRLIREATASGHGIGKSAEVAWIVHWAVMTHENTRGVVTANTDTQLRTKTWPEVAKWYGLLRFSLLRDLFKLEATSLFSTQAGLEKNWRFDAIPWSERNPEAFAGLHNAGYRTVVIKDEASAIPDIIWEVAEGALTDADTELLQLAYGNPTRNTGRFKEVVEGKFRHLWKSRQVDSREVKRTNKDRIDEMVDAYGEDSDIIRVRVKGQFPRAGSTQFIAEDIARAAAFRPPHYLASQPVVFGVDVARYGDDTTVLAVRQGRDARSIPWQTWQGTDAQRDLTRVAGDIAIAARQYHCRAIFVDKGAMGAGLIDALGAIGLREIVTGVDFGGKGRKIDWDGEIPMETANKRAEMWCSMRSWLQNGGAIPDERELISDLTGVEYGYRNYTHIELERKEDMKKRGLSSPDRGDALALTFAQPVDPMPELIDAYQMPKPAYDPYAELYQ